MKVCLYQRLEWKWKNGQEHLSDLSPSILVCTLQYVCTIVCLYTVCHLPIGPEKCESLCVVYSFNAHVDF